MTDSQRAVYEAISDEILSKQIDRPLLVAINGKDASGKTTMADNLAQHVSEKTTRQIIRISVDDFMNERAVRYTLTESAGRSCYEYTFNFVDFVKYALLPLHQNGSCTYKNKIFDHATDTATTSPDKVANADAIIVVDGVFLYKRDLANYWDLKILLRTDDEVVIERGARRDEERIGSYAEAKRKYIERYIASQTIYYDEEKPERAANIIVDNNDINAPFIVSQSSLLIC